MAKVSTKFYSYLLLIMLGLAVIFPLTQATYEGFKEGKKSRKGCAPGYHKKNGICIKNKKK